MSAKDGGFAFPTAEGAYEGMRLRDWFAGQALPSHAGEFQPEAAAVWAYRYADAMLAEREKARP